MVWVLPHIWELGDTMVEERGRKGGQLEQQRRTGDSLAQPRGLGGAEDTVTWGHFGIHYVVILSILNCTNTRQ